MNTPNFETDKLLPAIIQDATTNTVLMLGYMNQEAYDTTVASNRVTFYSRSKQRLWTKGETSNNYLRVQQILIDCDSDTILIKAHPNGPTCHTGTATCFNENNDTAFTLTTLQTIIENRIATNDPTSYTNNLLAKGINKVAQKLGEEAVELIIEAKDDNPQLFLGEAADLMYHYLVLLKAKGFTLGDVETVLSIRHQ